MMTVYLVTCTLEKGVIALLPMVLFPMLKLAPASKLPTQYFPDGAITFIGYSVLVAALDMNQVPKHLALQLVKRFVGNTPKSLLAGFMVTTWLLSAFLPAYVVLPVMHSIATQVIAAIRQIATIVRSESILAATAEIEQPEDVIEYLLDSGRHHESQCVIKLKYLKKVERAIFLAITICSALGDAAFPIGSEEIFMAKAVLETSSIASIETLKSSLFLTWSCLGLPLSLFLSAVAWTGLVGFYIGFGSTPLEPNEIDTVPSTLAYIKCYLMSPLGPGHYMIVVNFTIFILLLFCRIFVSLGPDLFIGWQVISPMFVSESTAAIFMTVLLALTPGTMHKKKADDSRGKRRFGLGTVQKPNMVVDIENDLMRGFPLGSLLTLGSVTAIIFVAQRIGLIATLTNLIHSITVDSNSIVISSMTILGLSFFSIFLPKQLVLLVMPIVLGIEKSRGMIPFCLGGPTAIAISMTTNLLYMKSWNTHCKFFSRVRNFQFFLLTTNFHPFSGLCICIGV